MGAHCKAGNYQTTKYLTPCTAGMTAGPTLILSGETLASYGRVPANKISVSSVVYHKLTQHSTPNISDVIL